MRIFLLRTSFYETLGRRVVSFFRLFGGIVRLGAQTVVLIPSKPLGLSRVFEQAKKIGIDSLPIVTLVSFFIGVILALQTAYIMQKMSSEI